MEIKPADKEIIDHKDLRYKRKVSNRGIKYMDKQAYEHTVGLVLSKRAGWWDNLKQWTKDKIEDPTGLRNEGRQFRIDYINKLRTSPRSKVILPEFTIFDEFTPNNDNWYKSKKWRKSADRDHRIMMNTLSDLAALARFNPPYIKDTNGNYAPAPGATYK